MQKWYSVTGTFEYPILAEDEDEALELAEQQLNDLGVGILIADNVKEF